MSQDVIFDKSQIRECFPKSEFRDGQYEAIEYACEAFETKDFVIMECPTGSGKSAIAMTLARMARSSYYLTITKILQDQLMSDFGSEVVELKGRNAYPCDFYERNSDKLRNIMEPDKLQAKLDFAPDCATGFCKTSMGRKDGHKCDACFLVEPPAFSVPKGTMRRLPAGKDYSACAYYEQVFKALNGKCVCMNFHSFLYQTMATRRFDDPRDLLIIDEGHNIENVLLDLVSFSLTNSNMLDLDLELPEFQTTQQYIDWLQENEVPDLVSLAIEIAKKNEDHNKEEAYSTLYRKLTQFLSSASQFEWVCQPEVDERDGNHSIVFKPVYIKGYSERLLFRYAKKVLILSATILDVKVFSSSLGIPKDRIATYRMKNRFPVENRPIYIDDCGPLTGGKDKMSQWMPMVVEKVDEICKRYPDQKGIIHTHNYAILKELTANCEQSSRFFTQLTFPDKRDLLEMHAKSSNGIIVAPAMHEGVDLKHDLSRFQIICKIPFPNFFADKQLNRRNELDQSYIGWLTALKLVQSYGRSIRDPNDYADTYIIDGSIHNFIKRYYKMLPSWFLEAIA